MDVTGCRKDWREGMGRRETETRCFRGMSGSRGFGLCIRHSNEYTGEGHRGPHSGGRDIEGHLGGVGKRCFSVPKVSCLVCGSEGVSFGVTDGKVL